LTEHYEKIREAVLGRNPGGSSRWGQAVLVNRGVAAWMQAVGPWVAPLRPPPSAASAVTAPVSPRVPQELVQLLSQAVLTVAQNTQVP
jgi:hypothetical protein